MGFIKIWSFKATNRISKVLSEDINKDGLDEILVASWDGFIYALDSQGRLMWKVRSPGATPLPASTVSVFRGGKLEILTGFHKNLVSISPNGSMEWRTQVDSWITELLCLENEGELRAFVFTRKGNMYVFTNDGEKISSRRISEKFLSAPKICISDVNFDYHKEILVAIKNRIMIFGPDGDEITSHEFPKEISNICADNFAVFVYSDGLYAMYADEKRKISSVMAKEILLGDVDGDYINEIIAITSDEIKVLKYDLEEKMSAKVISRRKISLDTFEFFTKACDINGDLKSEILVATSNDKLHVISIHDTSQKSHSHSFDVHYSPSVITMSNLCGIGKSDLIIQTGREEISAFTYVPKISLLSPPIKQKLTRIGILKSQKMQIHSSGLLIRKQTKVITRSNQDMESLILECVPTTNTAEIKLYQRKRIIYKQTIPVFYDRELNGHKYVFTTSEDIVLLKNVSNMIIKHPPQLVLKKIGNKINISAFEGIYPLTVHYKDKTGKTRKIFTALLVEKSIEATLSIPQYCLSEEIITVTLKNKSKLPLTIKAFIGKNALNFIHLNKETPKIVLPSNTTKTFKLIIKIPIKTHRKKAWFAISFLYGQQENKLSRHIEIPVYCEVVNKQWLKEKYKEYSKHLSSNELIEKLADELNLSKNIIKQFLSKLEAGSSHERKDLLKYLK